MLDFFKKIFAEPNKNKPLQNNLNLDELLIEGNIITKMKLSLSSKEENLQHLHKEMYLEELAELSPLPVGEIAFDGVYAFKDNDGLEVRFFIRNGLSWPINVDILPLSLVDDNNNIIAEQVFSNDEIGTIPGYSARPHRVVFSKANVNEFEKLELKTWRLKFDHEYEAPAKVEFENLPDYITADQRSGLNKYLNILRVLKPGELNFSPLVAELQEDGSLVAAIIIRNGSETPLKLEQLPLLFIDGQKRAVAGALFKIEDLEVGPKKAVLTHFTFPPESIKEKDIDFTKWSLSLAQQ